MKLTPAQTRFLNEYRGKGMCEVFAPRVATLRALKKAGLLEYKFLGMRWWYVKVNDNAKGSE